MGILIEGFWLTVGDIFWQFPKQREAYYVYREAAYRNRLDPLPFHKYLAAKAFGRL